MNLPSAKEQEVILKYLIETPSSDIWQDCDTEDRKKHWIYCRHFHLLLGDFLKNHFSGLPLPTRLTETHINIAGLQYNIVPNNPDNEKPRLIQRVGLYLDYYLAFYAVVSWGWRYIEPVLKANECSYPETPGEALVQVINEDFVPRFMTYFPEYIDGNYYVEFSPRKAYDLNNNAVKIKILEHKENRTRKEDNLISRYKPQVEKEKKKAMQFYQNLLFYLSICETNKAQDEVLDNRLKSLARAATAIKTSIHKLSHPRNKVRGHAINRGVRVEAAKGGTYSL